jgi:RNA polymerase sigma factor (sigma-70 family)
MRARQRLARRRLGCAFERDQSLPQRRGRLFKANSGQIMGRRSLDPFEVLSEMENRERLIEAMRELPERLTLVLQLFYVEELNHTEIAEVLEVSVPRVHQLRAKALKDLKKLMEADT